LVILGRGLSNARVVFAAAHNEIMRDIFTDIFESQPADPMQAARRAMRPRLRPRFYASTGVGEAPAGFQVLLDGKPVRTPARRPLAAPTRPLAELIAAEWQAQRETIDPAQMPLTRLANVIIDAVADTPAPVADAIEDYLGSDLLFYRAEAPERLVARQAELWDPVIAWAADALGARFVLVQGVTHAAQPEAAIRAVARAIPRDASAPANLWRLGALNSITTLTGSALLALALGAGRLDADTAWAAANVDEDWNLATWGRDELALERRAFRAREFHVAAQLLALLR
jgi:chaperone required for assembly of F1-ATPase